MAGLEAAIAARALYRRCLRVQRRWPAEADRPGRNVKDALRIQARARFRAVRDMKGSTSAAYAQKKAGLERARNAVERCVARGPVSTPLPLPLRSRRGSLCAPVVLRSALTSCVLLSSCRASLCALVVRPLSSSRASLRSLTLLSALIRSMLTSRSIPLPLCYTALTAGASVRGRMAGHADGRGRCNAADGGCGAGGGAGGRARQPVCAAGERSETRAWAGS